MLSVGADPVVVEHACCRASWRARSAGSGWRRGGTPRSVRAGGRGAGPADPAAAGDLLERCGLRPLPRAVTPVLPGPPGGCGGGDLGGAAGPRRRAGVAPDHRGGGASGLDGAGLAVAVRRACRADPGGVRAAGTPRRTPAATWTVWPRPEARWRTRSRRSARRARRCAARRVPRCSRCRRRRWWRRVRVAGCWRPGHRRSREVDQHVPASVNDLAGRARVVGVAVDRECGVMLMASTPKKKQSSRADRARDIALYRYSLIRPLADPGLSPPERGKLVRELAAQVHLGPSGEPVTVSRATSGPLDPGVARRRVRRADPGRTRRSQPRTDAGRAGAGRARSSGNARARTAAHIARIIAAEQGWAPSARTLQRHFARLELATRPDGNPPQAFGRFEAAAPTSCGSATGCTARSSTAGGRCCSRCWTTTPATWSGTAGATARTPWACRPRCTTRSRPTAARSGCTATTAAAYSSHQLAWSAAVLDIKLVHSRPGKTAGQGQDRTLEPHRARPVPGRDRHRPGRRGRACVAGRAQPAVHRLAAPALPPRRALRNRRRPGRALPRRGPRPAAPHRTRRCCAGRSCGASSARSPRSPRCPCTATATRSTPPWSAASSTCCSPRST